MVRATIGIIGGSGLYAMEGVTGLEPVWLDTPFGKPSDAIRVGQLHGQSVAFLPRHGGGHTVAPHEINYRANIYALRMLGVKWVLSVSAVGSLKAEVPPGDFVVVDQFIDRTRTRPSTFFEDGVVAHVTLADPVCPTLAGVLTQAAAAVPVTTHQGGTYVCIEGPQFSTRAESHLYRQWGADVVGMTNLPEARLAREAEMAYATLAMSTDYDCWHETEEEVSVDAVLAVIKANVAHAQSVIAKAVSLLGDASLTSAAWTALEGAILTHPQRVSPAVRGRLSLLLDGRLPALEIRS